ncbi:Hint domain-containing protein [Pyxidicoccus caerfyrddinensis]|uniref:Hint domain-containing protein n=1 Tax=Pyxidicoccus caerfyrddinensis TaxID=2709663 RepID=UPI0013DC7E72|nr:Hint domain-containing protein [Pyxidicoccus caerfyrddinensis]
MRSIPMLALLLFVGLSSTASAQLATRCYQDDQLTTYELGMGRNAWARKCGYASTYQETNMNMEGEYIVFAHGCSAYPSIPAGSDCQFYVPTSEAAACIAGLYKLGKCYVGCYTPGEKLVFNGEFTGIADAYATGKVTVAGLTRDSESFAPRFSEQPIRTFIVGDTKEDIFLLKTSAGHEVQVTSEHPMVDESGTVVKAKTLKVGDKLLTAEGKKVTLTSVSVFAYEGQVWNVQPASHDKKENILNVEGLLTGSVRFQNEWAQESFRLSLRDDFDTQGL